MALPALAAVYLLGAPLRWWKRLLHLAAATVVLLAVSFAWVAAVDLTPASQRPFVGSSPNNTVLGLILGHNGLSRLGLGNLTQTVIGTMQGTPPQNPVGQPPIGGDQPGQPQPGGQPNQPQPGGQPNQPQPGNQRANEVGFAGPLRLFTQPLAQETGWLLPLALLGIPLGALAAGWKWPLSERHLSLLLWALWLLPMMAYFSFTTGIWHTYYLIMLGPALAALAGIALWAAGKVVEKFYWPGLALLLALAAGTLAFQAFILANYPAYLAAVMAAAALAALAGLVLLALRRVGVQAAGWSLLCLGLLIAPLVFSFLTSFNAHPDTGLPNAGPDTSGRASAPGGIPLSGGQDRRLLDYLLANTPADGYLAAATSSHEAAPFILATGRGVLTFGGFNGGDNVVSVEKLAGLVREGKLRFIFASQNLDNQKPQLARWVKQNCTLARQPGGAQFPGTPAGTLFDCARR
jgi:4-amino-4-deoxy-L-arabinose transferase-like glycosyltransferase